MKGPMMLKSVLPLLLSFCLVPSWGCIHTSSSTSTVIMDLGKETNGLVVEKFDELTVGSMTFHPRTYPLEGFFTRIWAGEFRDAFKRMDFSYTSSNTDSEALSRVMEQGFVPVYFKIENRGTKPIDLAKLNLQAVSGDVSRRPIDTKELPEYFSELDVKALGANVYNTAVVVGAAVVFVVVLSASYAVNTAVQGGIYMPQFADQRVYNDVRKKTPLAYQDYLFEPTVLKEGMSAQGVLFFRFPKEKLDWNDLKLKMSWL